MAFFKNYNFEYNAQRVDLFKSVVVCSYQDETDLFKEGIAINIDAANFYGVITSSKNSGERFALDITAESWGRELRNNAITETADFRQVNAVKLIEDHLLPASWDFEYPEEFDYSPRYVSYSLKNGSYMSHISTVLDSLGLDFTIYSTLTGGNLRKVVKAYYRDNFDDRTITEIEERKQFGALSITADYGKIATSIIVMGAESEQGINQTVMDAEIGDWHKAPRLISIRDCSMKKPEMSAESVYFWYYPASETDASIEILVAGDIVTIDSEQLQIAGVYYLPEVDVASWEAGTLAESAFPTKLQPIANYDPAGVIVASVTSGTTSVYVESAKRNYSFPSGRAISNYFGEAAIHAIYDDVFISAFEVSSSDYLTFEKNLPSSNGFLWLGSERVFYRTASDFTSYYSVTGAIRGVPTCAVASCEHCGTENDPNVHVCSLLQQSGYLYDHCDLLKTIRAKFTGLDVSDMRWCPLCIDNDSVCPAMKCPHVQNDTDFATICPKGLTKPEIEWTPRYQHHKGSIVFPASYYDAPTDTYDIYASDSLIHTYGYLPTRVSVKGIADVDGLDMIAEGRLRLSAVPIVGKFTLFNYDPWTVPDGYFPGDVIKITTASHAKYDNDAQMWYPSYWFNVASTDPGSGDWVQVSSPGAAEQKWVKYKQEFVIQKTVKQQRGMPEISFGAGDIGFQNLTDYIMESEDVTSQRHRNQDPSRIIDSSETGLAAKVQNLKTGAVEWVRMVR